MEAFQARLGLVLRKTSNSNVFVVLTLLRLLYQCFSRSCPSNTFQYKRHVCLIIGMAKKALVLPGLSSSIALARSEPLHGGQNNILAMIMRRSLLE